MVNKVGLREANSKALSPGALQSPLILILDILSSSPLSMEHSCGPRARGAEQQFLFPARPVHSYFLPATEACRPASPLPAGPVALRSQE